MRSIFRPLATTVALLALLCFPAGVGAYEQELDKLSQEMAQDIAKAGKSTLAVVDFTDLQGNVTALGRFLAEEFSVALADAGQGFRVIDRTHLASILREHELSETGLIDPSTARELGKITGVEALITGSLTPFGDSVRIAVKILDTESATIIGSARGNIAKTGAIGDLLVAGIGGPGGGPAPASGPVAAPPASQVRAQQTVESDEISFALRGCKVAGGKVTCDFIITNQGKDRDLYLDYRSRIFDEYGNEYAGIDGKLGNKSAKFSRSSFSNKVISGIPTKAEISFSKIADESRLLTMLEIHCYYFNVQFRNVPVTR